jgi:transcription antitermination protein NusB
LRALYVFEMGGITLDEALAASLEAIQDEEIGEELTSAEAPTEEVQILIAKFARQIMEGVWQNRHEIDDKIDSALNNFDFDRLAAIDRNILRVAMFELIGIPYIAPAVTVNEAIEIAKRYSTVESGKFVHGVLGRLVKMTPKAQWTPESSPPDPDLPELERIQKTPKPVVVEETIEEASEEAKLGQKFGVWKLKSEEDDLPPDLSGPIEWGEDPSVPEDPEAVVLGSSPKAEEEL